MHLCPSGTSPLKEFSSPWTEIDSPSHRARHLISRDRLGFRVSVHLSLHLICFKCIFFIFFAEKFPSLASLSWGMVNIKDFSRFQLHSVSSWLLLLNGGKGGWGQGDADSLMEAPQRSLLLGHWPCAHPSAVSRAAGPQPVPFTWVPGRLLGLAPPVLFVHIIETTVERQGI